MNISTKLVIIISLFSLTACSGTGGIIGNLIPAPKFLDGEVIGDIYYSPENAFNVRLPHPPDSDHNEWIYTKIHEIKDQEVIGIVLGPAAFDWNTYHAVLIRGPMPNADSSKEDYVKGVFRKKVASRNISLSIKHYSTRKNEGKTTYYAIYSGSKSLLVLSLTDNEDSFYVIEADIVRGSTHDGFISIDQLINREWGIFNSMYKSFTITDASYKP